MFGVLRGCSPQLSPASHQEWWGHICGLCLTLRDQAGQASRITTNFDAAALSVLYAAQRAEAGEQRSSVCALRGMRRLDVVSSEDAGARYATAVSLLMASTRIRDSVSDGDGWVGRIPRLAERVARRWDSKAERIAAKAGFDTDLIRSQTAAQLEVEQIKGADFRVYAAPTEAALEQIGRMYGRMMLLLDSYEDRKEDAAQGRFNALEGCPPDEIKRYAQALFDEAMAAIRRHWAALELPRPGLAETLLLGMLPMIGARALRMKTSAVCLSAAPILAAPLMGGAGGNQPPGYYDPSPPQGGPDQSAWGDQPPPPLHQPDGCRENIAAGLAFCCVNPFRRRHGQKSRCCCDGCCDCCYCCDADCCDADCCDGCNGCDACNCCECCSCDC